MRFNRNAIHTFFLLSLPLVVAAFGLNVFTAAALVGIALVWRWALILSGLLGGSGQPELVLETIGASHFVEKVRWCLDRLGLDYREQQNVGTLGVFFAGRTVPKLYIRTGLVTSAIGDSPAILRYLWGRYAEQPGMDAGFLRPTAEAVALEKEVDRYGVWLQQWIYHFLLSDRKLSLNAWGARDTSLPIWQRAAIIVLFPLQRVMMRRAFRLHPGTHAKTVSRIEGFLRQVDDLLEDGRQDLLGVGQTTFVDISFAALSGVWIWPPQYGGGKADAVRPADTDYPEAMNSEIQRWRAEFPRAVSLVESLYATQRGQASG